MQNITKTREVLAQVRLCCLEIAHGCEQLEEAEFTNMQLDELAKAVWELHLAVKPLVNVDPALDHDGDTQPANEKPEPPILGSDLAGISFDAEPPWMRDP